MNNSTIRDKIYIIRNVQVMLDFDLAAIYGYEVKALNQQVKRNLNRFPDDFMFKLTKEELDFVKSQFATSRIIDGTNDSVKSQIVTSPMNTMLFR